jgi:4-amino-4-deoxy-L-arabinose transferase-like glycosyltransferase
VNDTAWQWLRGLHTCAAWKGGWPALAGIILISLLFRMPQGGPVAPAHGDVPAYLTGAYHLHADHLYSMSPLARPELGREPAYPAFLAMLMQITPAFARFTPACLTANDTCPASMFRIPRLANLGFILATGVMLFILARLLTGRAAGGLIAAGYVLLNTHANKGWGDLLSDRFAVFLVATAMLALALAFKTGKARSFAAAGALFAILTLTKAIFLPFCVLAWCASGACAWRANNPTATRALLAAATTYILLVGGWIVRNWHISGMARLTDARSGIALSTRAVFDAMSLREYAASLVFWTGSTGPKLAARWFGQQTADRFDLRSPGGYYDIGQNGYGSRVVALMRADHLSYWQAASKVDHQIVADILRHLPGYAASMLPLTYRGLWVDEFLWLGMPCLCIAAWRAWRDRNTLLGVLLGLGLFNMIAYAALSLNIERYQLTALPAMALAAACALIGSRRGLLVSHPPDPGRFLKATSA